MKFKLQEYSIDICQHLLVITTNALSGWESMEVKERQGKVMS